jgi:hypothetical protein
MKKVLSIIVMVALMCSFVGCASAPAPTTPTTSTHVTAERVSKEFKADFVESKVVTIDFSDGTKDMLLMFFDCTNETGHTIAPMDGIDIDTFQNGVALGFFTLYDLEEMGDAVPCDTEMQNGASATVVWFFELKDDSPVSVELGNGETFTVEVK